jgi:hypothetical protein
MQQIDGTAHADMMTLMAEWVQKISIELASAEPDEEFIRHYQDALFETFKDLPEPIGFTMTVGDDVLRVKMVFRISASKVGLASEGSELE